MKKFKLGEIKIKKADPQQLTDKLLLINLYITQGLTLFIGLIWILLQKRNPIHILNFPENAHFVFWGLGLAAVMLVVDFLLTHIVPEDSMDDGGLMSCCSATVLCGILLSLQRLSQYAKSYCSVAPYSIHWGRTGRAFSLLLFMCVICATGFQPAGYFSAATVSATSISIPAVYGHRSCATSS